MRTEAKTMEAGYFDIVEEANSHPEVLNFMGGVEFRTLDSS